MLLTVADVDALIAALRAAGSPLPDHLAPGLDDATMDRLTAPADLVLPAEARVWWGYADGVPRSAPDAALAIGPLWWWAPLVRAWTTALQAGAAHYDPAYGVVVPDVARVAALGLPTTIY